MKLTTPLQISGALFAAAAISLTGCKKTPEESTDSGVKTPAPAAPTKSGETKAPAGTAKVNPAPAPAPAKATGGSLAEQVLGLWAPDKDAMIAAMKEEAAAEGQAGELDQFAMTMIEQMAGSMTMEIKEDVAVINMGALGSQSAPYKFLKGDPATGDFSIEITEPGSSEAKVEKGNIKGDRMIMESNGQPMIMNRITKADLEARKAAGGGLEKALMDGIKGALEEGGLGGEGAGAVDPEAIAEELKKALEAGAAPE